MKKTNLDENWTEMRFQIFILFFLLLSCRNQKEIRSHHLTQVSGPYTHLDPQVVSGLSASLILAKVHEALYEVNPYKAPFDLRPLLAEDFPEVSDDGKTYLIRIKKDVQYHPCKCFKETRYLKAQDFVNSFKRMSDPRLLSPHYAYFSKYIQGMKSWYELQKTRDQTQYSIPLTGVSAKSDHLLEIRLEKPNLDFLYLLTSPNISPIPMEAITFYKNDLSRNAIGTGPFKLIKEVKNHKLEFKKFDQYHPVFFPTRSHPEFEELIKANRGRRLPLLDSITTIISKESQTSWLNLLKGNIDYLEVEKDNHQDVFEGRMISPDLKKKGFVIGRDNGQGNLYYFGFNNQKAPLNNPDIRKAIAKAFNYSKYNELFFNSQAIVAQSYLPPSIPGNEPPMKTSFNKKNISAAKDLLKNHQEVLRPLKMIVKNKTVSRQVGEFLKSELEKIGVDLILETVSFPELLKRATKGDYDIFYLSWLSLIHI